MPVRSPLRMRHTPDCIVNELSTRMIVAVIGTMPGSMTSSRPLGGHG